MFNKTSRYYKIPDEVILDSAGGTNEAKSLRLLPDVSGTFRHIVEEGDRLDRMAYKYYKKSRKWWRICDANPDYFLPPALLGRDALAAYRIPVESLDPEPPWAGLLRSLLRASGVEHVAPGTAEVPHPEIEAIAGALLYSLDPALEEDLNTSVRTQELTVPLRDALSDEGITFIAGAGLSAPGPDQWLIADHLRKTMYFLRLDAGTLNVYEAYLHQRWSIDIIFNSLNCSIQDVVSRVEAAGFDTGAAVKIGRIGKSIVIPADTVG